MAHDFPCMDDSPNNNGYGYNQKDLDEIEERNERFPDESFLQGDDGDEQEYPRTLTVKNTGNNFVTINSENKQPF